MSKTNRAGIEEHVFSYVTICFRKPDDDQDNRRYTCYVTEKIYNPILLKPRLTKHDVPY
jgi:hypothetical protein